MTMIISRLSLVTTISITLAIAASHLGGCAGSSSSEGKAAALGEEFTLRAGESAQVGKDIRITFNGVEADSRCPEGVQCVWEGNARAGLVYAAPGHQPISFALNTSSRYTRDTTIDDHHIELRGVEPAKREGVTIDSSEYSVTLVVR